MQLLRLALLVMALVAVALAADGPSVRDLCNGECPLTAEAVTVTPYPPVKGSPATLNVRGELSGSAVSGGVVSTATYYKGKATENSTCDLFACPVQPGKVNETITMTVPEELPAGSYKTILEINDANNAYIGHFEILFSVKDNDNIPDKPVPADQIAVRLGKRPQLKNK